MEKKHEPRTTLNLERATRLAQLNVYSIKPGTENKSVCVDPRYGYIECRIQERPMAKPGADLGDLMNTFSVMHKLGITLDDPLRERVFGKVVKTVGGEENFSFHTDTHAEHDTDGLPGCGHFKKAMREPNAYGVETGDMEFINGKTKAFAAKADILKEEHEEQAVFVVMGDKISINPLLTDENGAKIQAFHYNADLVKKRIKLLAQNLLELVNEKKPEITLEQLEDALAEAEKMQLDATLQRLAKGLNVFEISGDSPQNMQIKHVGAVN